MGLDPKLVMSLAYTFATGADRRTPGRGSRRHHVEQTPATPCRGAAHRRGLCELDHMSRDFSPWLPPQRIGCRAVLWISPNRIVMGDPYCGESAKSETMALANPGIGKISDHSTAAGAIVPTSCPTPSRTRCCSVITW